MSLNNTRRHQQGGNNGQQQPSTSLLAELLLTPDQGQQPNPPPSRTFGAVVVGWLGSLLEVSCAWLLAWQLDRLLVACAIRADGWLAGFGLQLLLLLLNLGFIHLHSSAVNAPTPPLVRRCRRVFAVASIVGAVIALAGCLRRPCRDFFTSSEAAGAVAAATTAAVSIAALRGRASAQVGTLDDPAAIASALFAAAALRVVTSSTAAAAATASVAGFHPEVLRLLPVTLCAVILNQQSQRSRSSLTSAGPGLLALAAFGFAESVAGHLLAPMVTVATATATTRLLAVARAVAACPLAAGAMVCSGSVLIAASAAAGAAAAAAILAVGGPSTQGLAAGIAWLGRAAALAQQIGWGAAYIRHVLRSSESTK